MSHARPMCGVMVRVVAPHFVAGMIIDGDCCVEAALAAAGGRPSFQRG